jgi:hypothetical protein
MDTNAHELKPTQSTPHPERSRINLTSATRMVRHHANATQPLSSRGSRERLLASPRPHGLPYSRQFVSIQGLRPFAVHIRVNSRLRFPKTAPSLRLLPKTRA